MTGGPMKVRFSPHQVQIIGLIATGASDKEIAGKLGISVPTVRTHLQRVYRDRALRNRADAVALLVANSMLSVILSLAGSASSEMMSSLSMTSL